MTTHLDQEQIADYMDKAMYIAGQAKAHIYNYIQKMSWMCDSRAVQCYFNEYHDLQISTQDAKLICKMMETELYKYWEYASL